MTAESFQLFKNFDIKKIYSLMEFFKVTFNESYMQSSDRHCGEIIFASDLSRMLADKVLEQYINYAQRHNLAIEDVCPYKIISWYSYMLADHIYLANKSLAVKVISTAIGCMQIILEKEGVKLENAFTRGVLRMIILEIAISKRRLVKDTSNSLGLGLNGFYMVFKTASICQKS